ncbi:MAG: HAD-IIIC family phosphatase [Ruminococcus sp.]|nr:HAD-IIIC family phosphatase [Ruminococcus sp.]
MKELEYPFDPALIMRRRRAIKKALLEDGSSRIKKRIAVLAGSTADDVVSVMELFLLDSGIEPEFYISDYNRFYEDAVFGSPELDAFRPEIVYIHTNWRNLAYMPQSPAETAERAEELLEAQRDYFRQIWTGIVQRYGCPVVQNNFDYPPYRRAGSFEGWSAAGTGAFTDRMNVFVSEYARHNNGFYVNDISFLSAAVGLRQWNDPEAWHLYKNAVSRAAVPELAFSVSNIIRSVYGRNKKVIALDLDNTLWGGVIGDDGQEGIELGQETAAGQAFQEVQDFLGGYRKMGVLLTVCSKNEEENALLGLNHPESRLRPDDFAAIKANWLPKDENISQTAQELGLLTESFVFADDNPAECEIVREQLPGTAVVNAETPDILMDRLTFGGWFEVTSLTEDDLKRNEQYAANAKRLSQKKRFESYGDYLLSLEMTAEIDSFQPVQLSRITQLVNKSNQFNLTTKRLTPAQTEQLGKSPEHIAICGRLSDKFGDSGIVSVVCGRIEGKSLHIELWLMSCRVLKRDMEYAMLDELVRRCRERGISELVGYYYRTAKNAMVSELYGSFGFERVSLSDSGDSVWRLDINGYKNKNHVIKIKEYSYGQE